MKFYPTSKYVSLFSSLVLLLHVRQSFTYFNLLSYLIMRRYPMLKVKRKASYSIRCRRMKSTRSSCFYTRNYFSCINRRSFFLKKENKLEQNVVSGFLRSKQVIIVPYKAKFDIGMAIVAPITFNASARPPTSPSHSSTEYVCRSIIVLLYPSSIQ